MRPMASVPDVDLKSFVGRAPDRLTLAERESLASKYIAREVYTPKTLPLQRIEAIGDSVGDCVAMLRGRGLDPGSYEFVRLPPSY